MGFKRIPSPRSDLFSGISPQPVNTACMSHVNASSLGVFSSGNQPTALRSNIQQRKTLLKACLPLGLIWNRPIPYHLPLHEILPPNRTLSLSISLNLRVFSGTYSMSHANSNAATLEGYSLGPMQDRQHVSVIQRTSVGKGEPLNSMRRELCVGEQENFRAYRLPKAFQGGDSRSDSSSSNAVFNALPDASAREHLMRRQPYLNDHSTGNLNNREASIPLVHLTIPARPPSSDSPSSTGSRKNIVSDSTVTGSTAAKSSSSSPKIVKKSLSSKGKETVYPSLEKTNGSPVFHPSEEEFRDPISYIKMISRDAAKFGLCVIVPPESWKPEFQVPDNLRFNSECQLIHRLVDRWGPMEEELACIKKHLDQQSISLVPMPQIGGYELDLPQFSKVVKQFGGLQKVIDSKKWTKIADMLKIPRAAQDRIGKLQDIYCKYLLSYDLLPKEEKAELLQLVQSERESSANCEQDTDSSSVKGRSLSLVPFQRLARNVQGHFFKNPPSVNDVEMCTLFPPLWSHVMMLLYLYSGNSGGFVHSRENYVSVHRGSLDTNQENSCFPTDKANAYSKHGWNLNVLPHLPGSVLKHLGFVQDITVPWLQFDMIFSVKSWQTHPLALYTVDYLHSGAEKIWYSIPAGEKQKFISLYGHEDNGATETAQVDKMVSPSTLTDSGVTVTRVVQKQGHFVIVFPEAYYSSVSCGSPFLKLCPLPRLTGCYWGSKRYKTCKARLGGASSHMTDCCLAWLKS
ncbi:Jumonji and AT-rich interaction domain containing 2 [Desmophyllum pertusum]|uniref:Jumonji and AT-rich interaction domain containing 2 n=1 Tax=Desmophyllum pertusum TaxID=174260 RepID=A0A9W9Z3S8_9CNID|nr:Jumonji and AT-rich interaction domain containing 2 [Desmophyllum pertusum]